MDEVAKKAHQVFVKALDLAGDARSVYLHQACGDDGDLRAAVESLLAAFDNTNDFLESPALTSLGLRRDAAHREDRQFATGAIDGLTLVRRLGFGGMAEVYEAEQQSPKRLVAVKILHGALTGTNALQRFHFEADTLARLNHPAIAQVFDAGTCMDAAGQRVPYFVMEYVAGGSTIADYIQQQDLTRSEYLRIFAEVTDAVQFGHQAGVIHRDLKPGNILVNEQGRPKVIDFGVAKAIQPQLKGITVEHDREAIIGTLNYMSPEQCAPDRPVDTRSDIYSLGVVLFELVTGQRPYDLSGSSIVEAVQAVQTRTPPAPENLQPDLPKELSAIILKALAKDPDQRYLTASEFAADVRRFLQNRPVVARPPSVAYQLRMFAKRNPALCTAVGCFLLALLGGIVGTTRMAYVAATARDEAEARQAVLEQVTAFQESQLVGVDVAEMGNQLRSGIIADMRSALTENPEGDTEEVEARVAEFANTLAHTNFTTLAQNTLQQSVLERSLESIQADYENQPLVRARLLQGWATMARKLGWSEKAAPELKRAWDIRLEKLGAEHRQTLEAKRLFASTISTLGSFEEGIELLTEVLNLHKRLHGPNDPDTLSAASSLGSAYEHAGKYEDAQRHWEDTLERRRRVLGANHVDTLASLNNVGLICATQGDFDRAEVCWRELLEHRDALPKGSTMYTTALTNVGVLLTSQAKYEEASPLLEEALAILRAEQGDQHPSTLLTMGSVARVRASMDDIPGALQLLLENVASRRLTMGSDHPKTLRAMFALAEFYQKTGKEELARSTAREAVNLQRQSLGDDHIDTIIGISSLARLLRDTNVEEAEQLHQLALQKAKQLLGEDHLLTQTCAANYGATLAAAGRADEAKRLLLPAYETASAAMGPRAFDSRRIAQALVTVFASSNDEDATEQLQKWTEAARPPEEWED